MSTNIVKSDDDCYFFFNATCTKGDACPFRHSNVAYGSDVVCSFWREGKCIKGVSCKYRHMEIRKSRNKVECFFERQPGGCKKLHCPFLHSTRRAIGEDAAEGVNSETVDLQSSSSEQLIPNVSISDQESKGIGPGDNGGEILFGLEPNLNENYPKPCASPPFSPNSSTTKLLPTSPTSTAATIGSEPVSISIDIAEESENEPEDIGCSEKKSIKLTSFNHNVEQNFGIKTLEQIRMEKVFRQNDVNRQSLDPEPTGTSSKQFRVKLKRKSLSANNNNSNTTTSTSPTGVLITTNANTFAAAENEGKPVSPGLGVKSLDEIRREKEQINLQSNLIKMSTDCEKDDGKPKKVIKIKRTHIEINKPSEPPSKIVKINKAPVNDGSKKVTIKPLIKCNQSPIQDSKLTKVQQLQPLQTRHLRPTPPPPTTTTSSDPSKASPKQPLRLKLKTPANPPPVSRQPATIKKPVPLEVKSTKLELKKLTISQNKQTTIKPTDGHQSVSNLEKSTNLDQNQSQNLNLLHSSYHHQQDDYNVIADDDNIDEEEEKEGEDNDKYDSDSSSNLSLKSNDKQVDDENRMNISSPTQLRQEAEESQSDRIVGDDDDFTVNLEETNSPSKNDDDLLEEDDLLADGESAPEDVAIEDEDDEFLKEIEHVINS